MQNRSAQAMFTWIAFLPTICLAADPISTPLSEEYKAALAVIGTFIVGLSLYFIKAGRQRYSIRQALISEINLLLGQLDDYKRYLLRDDHKWCNEGSTLTESPVFVPSNYRVFSTSLPFLWLLPTDEMKKILLFYSQVENCEKLIEILFGRIQGHEKGAKAITKDQVKRRVSKSGLWNSIFVPGI